MERMVLNPKILGGKPVVQGTCISVQFVLKLLSAGMETANIVSEYPRRGGGLAWPGPPTTRASPEARPRGGSSPPTDDNNPAGYGLKDEGRTDDETIVDVEAG